MQIVFKLAAIAQTVCSDNKGKTVQLFNRTVSQNGYTTKVLYLERNLPAVSKGSRAFHGGVEQLGDRRQ